MEIAISLLTLTALEIVLGIDNLVFISVLADKLPESQRPKARKIGLILALLARLVLLAAISWVMGLTKDLFYVSEMGISGKDLILFFGGLFLLTKSTHEIHAELEGPPKEERAGNPKAQFSSVLLQIVLLDIVFSLDSVITGVGLVDQIWVIVVAMLVSMAVMLLLVKSINDFITRHPSVKMLALSFLILVGVMLVADAFDQHIPRGYIYFSMAFSLFVELLNIRRTKKNALAKKAEANNQP